MNNVILFDLFAFVAAFLASAVFTPAARDLAFKVRLLDHPGPRKVHAAPMPLLGGLAVYLAAVFAGNVALVPVNVRRFLFSHISRLCSIGLLKEEGA